MILNKQQNRVVFHQGGPLLVLACPGSGKTRCIVERITHLIDEDIAAKKILAVTFTNKAANEMAERVREKGYGHKLLICTFHSLCVRILRQCCHLLGYKRNFSICDDPEKLIRKITKSQGYDPQSDEYAPKRLIKIIEDKYNQLLEPEIFEEGLKEEYLNIFREYEKTLKTSNSFDFGGLIYYTVKMFQKFPKIKAAYAARWTHVLVDEMQDTNIAQLELVKALTSKYRNVIVVGDEDQSIYKFRGACPENILNFQEHFPEAEIAHLSTNYRSTPEILTVAEKLINKNKNRQMVPLTAHKGSGDKPQVIEHETPEIEAEEIANLINTHKYDGIPYKEIAILCRINSLTRTFEECFRRRDIPYILIGAFGFYDRAEVKTGVSYMKFLANQEDLISFEEIINTPSRGVGPATLIKIMEHAINNNTPFLEVCRDPSELKGVTRKAKAALQKFVSVIDKYDPNNPSYSLNVIFEDTGFLEHLRKTDKAKGEHREDNVLELLRAFDNYCHRKKKPTLDQYIQEILLLTSADKETTDDAVRLMTAHAAKGLEFDVVFIPGMIEDIFPHKRSVKEGNISEERRVCYVACTRARYHLYLSRAGVKMEDGKMIGTMPSRFLEDMGLIKIDWDSGFIIPE